MTQDVVNYVSKVLVDGESVHQFDMFVSKEILKDISDWFEDNNYNAFREDWHPWENNTGVMQSVFISDDEVAAHFRLQWEELAH